MNFTKSTVYLTVIVALGWTACDGDSNKDRRDGGLLDVALGKDSSGESDGLKLDRPTFLDAQKDSQVDVHMWFQADSSSKQDGKIDFDGSVKWDTGAPKDTGEKSDGQIDAPYFDAPSTCIGSDPAMVQCRKSTHDCVPSACFCSRDGYWGCTADCRSDLPICGDGGMNVSDADENSGKDAGKGVACGSKICGVGTYCCNESCGICAPLGGGCITLQCAP